MVIGGLWSIVGLFKPMIEGIKASLNSLNESKVSKNQPLEEKRLSHKLRWFWIINLDATSFHDLSRHNR